MSIYELEVNTEADDAFIACGLEDGDMDKYLKEFASLIRSGSKRKSEVLEEFIKDIGTNEKKHRFLIVMASIGMDHVVQDNMMRMMQQMMKKRGQSGMGGEKFDGE